MQGMEREPRRSGHGGRELADPAWSPPVHFQAAAGPRPRMHPDSAG